MAKIYRSGDLRGEKLTDGEDTWCCIWYPLPDFGGVEDENSGMCFDFQESDIPELTLLLGQLATAPADAMDDED